MAKTLMIQGTGSHVGKSVLVTALCRWFARKGLRVAPFKAQNMALNSFVTPGGCEIGWAQAVQAEACGIAAQADINPVLLKPTGDKRSQVIVMGKPLGHLSARAYEAKKRQLWPQVCAAFDRLRSVFDVVVLEGAGSPAEINLKRTDIVNMRMARYARCPVLLIGDIDRGGVFASLVGTLRLLSASERRMMRGLIINKFRGDVGILRPGLKALQRQTGKPVLGVLPYLPFALQDQEDSVALDDKNASAACNGKAKIRVAVMRTPRLSNFTDFDALRAEPCVSLQFVQHARDWNDPDLILLAGSKSTLEDLAFLRRAGLDKKIVTAASQGRHVLGICGGYQMLGRNLRDAHGVESAKRSARGLGLLNVNTEFSGHKSLHQVQCRPAMALPGMTMRHRFAGYEIHMGQTHRMNGARPLFLLRRAADHGPWLQDGAISARDNVWGTYVHGLFLNDGFRHGLLRSVARQKGLRLSAKDLLPGYAKHREHTWDALADWVDEHLDMKAICRAMGLR